MIIAVIAAGIVAFEESKTKNEKVQIAIISLKEVEEITNQSKTETFNNSSYFVSNYSMINKEYVSFYTSTGSGLNGLIVIMSFEFSNNTQAKGFYDETFQIFVAHGQALTNESYRSFEYFNHYDVGSFGYSGSYGFLIITTLGPQPFFPQLIKGEIDSMLVA